MTPRLIPFLLLAVACGDKSDPTDTSGTNTTAGDDTGGGLVSPFSGNFVGTVSVDGAISDGGPTDSCTGDIEVHVDSTTVTATGLCTWQGDFTTMGFADIGVDFSGTLTVDGETATLEAALGPDPITGTVTGTSTPSEMSGTLEGSGTKEGTTVVLTGSFNVTKE